MAHRDTFRKLAVAVRPRAGSSRHLSLLGVWNDLLSLRWCFPASTIEVAIISARLNELAGASWRRVHLLTAGAFVFMAVPLIAILAF
jgi:alpha-glucoside transport system permease protein